jgi:hypothetical protein
VSEEAVLDTRHLKVRLLMPTGNEHYDSFRKFIASRMPDELVAVGIPMLLILACADIERGIDGFTGKPLGHRLTGMPASVLNGMVHLILREFPEPFSSEARLILANASLDKPSSEG